jgi:beta-glucosidase
MLPTPENVKLYIRDVESSLPRPVKELKAFKKVLLQPGQTNTVTFTINKSALSFFDGDKHEWIAESGDFEAIIGASAVDVKGKTTFVLR